MGIKNEAESQHSLLDNIDSGMGSARSFLGSVNDKFKVVMNDKQSRKMIGMVVATVVGLVGLWYLINR
eukprot:CAMPEP_0202902942 /NCGR_PEP_ID=MMETSP1392-20130828/19361_1 /ASSEMBLY_ACC=CAM_ASM_000868 /TAXON_ID=225041 /ORGANISM="Chlamydomonas chlamydogama, Strain SAG 11-48b" /LENGTH=67 /DNA_ID=CAMNT_0049589823 /DNA_START=216 /DNA_END=419 /DNA_ORIENTATION=-